jgi:hypothetical protein
MMGASCQSWKWLSKLGKYGENFLIYIRSNRLSNLVNKITSHMLVKRSKYVLLKAVKITPIQ